MPDLEPQRSGGRVALVDLTGAEDMTAALRELQDQWGPVAPVDLEPGVPGWLVLGHAEVMEVMRTESVFARNPRHWREQLPPQSTLHAILSPNGRRNLYFADGAEHRRLRLPVDEAFAAMDEVRTAALVRVVCARLIDSFAARGSADLMGEYAAAVSFLAVSGMFGFDERQGVDLLRCASEIFGHGGDPASALVRMDQIVMDHVIATRAKPGPNLTTSFIEHPNFEDDTEIVHSMVIAICAANEMLVTWIAATLRRMLTDPRYTGRVTGVRRGLDDAMDETLWNEPPVANLPARYAVTDCTLGTARIRAGDAIVMGVAAANNDPRVRTSDDLFEAGNRSHLSFGVGPHACPAKRPGRLVVKIAVESLMERLDLRLTDPVVTWAPSPWSRYPSTLPVTFTPERQTARTPARV
ncbi:cytochrome P450 [Promicromonospora citrea]|nr:cytochrome P450 [Promicromonospora citrea]NNH51005.1 cytochrome P450 [Promicromonospora citrea]